MQPSHAWARTHTTTQSPHATAASCHHCSQSRPSTPLGESPGVGGGGPRIASSLLLSGLYWRSKQAAGKKGDSGKKVADGGYPGQLETGF